MDFNIKKPSHILSLILLSLSFIVIILMPVLSFFGFFGAAGSQESIQQLKDMSSSFRLIVEVITLFIQFASVIFLMIIVPVLWYLLVNKYNLKEIFKSLMLKKEDITKSLLFGALAAGLMFCIVFIMEIGLIEAGIKNEDLSNAQDIAEIFSPVTMFILVVFQPIPEEIFFRGFLLEKINFLWGKNVAVVLSAVLFGVAHLSYQKFIPGLLIIFVGLILGYLVLKTRNLYSVIFAHILFNVTSFLLFMLS